MSAEKTPGVIQRRFVQLGKMFNSIKKEYRARFTPSDPIRLVVFQGHGTPSGVFRISGRVLEGEPPEDPAVDAPLEDNIRDMMGRMVSRQIPYAQVSCGSWLVPEEPSARDPSPTGEMFTVPSTRVETDDEHLYTVYCDKEGYFTLEGSSAALVTDPRSIWQPITLELSWPQGRGKQRFLGRCQVPKDPAYGIISDIDDTIVFTGATRLRTMLKTTFSDNARSRRPFPGVVAFYKALHEGTRPGQKNPFFYVSSSPWNLYDFLVSFLNYHQIPQGTFYLRDLEIGRQKSDGARHEAHKLNAIESVMDLHKDLSFILVGDSGQHDPSIYAKVVARYPNRVLAIIIRDVTGLHRHAELAHLARHVEREYGVPMLIEPDLQWAAHLAARRKWIRRDAVASVEESIRLSYAEPFIGPPRKILRRGTRNVLLLGAVGGAALTSWYYVKRRKGRG